MQGNQTGSLRRLYDLTSGITNPYQFIKLNNAARADRRIWSEFIDSHNGTSVLLPLQFLSSNILKLHTDAAQSKGFACTYQQFWSYGPFSHHIQTFHINVLELYPITLAVLLFGHMWSNKNILFFATIKP